MSSYTNPRIYAWRASAAIAIHRFVKFGADNAHVTIAGAAEVTNGIAMNSALAAGDTMEIACVGGGAKLQLGGTVTRGAVLASDATGRGVVATTGQWAGAIAQADGVVGDIIPVEVVAHRAA